MQIYKLCTPQRLLEAMNDAAEHAGRNVNSNRNKRICTEGVCKYILILFFFNLEEKQRGGQTR